jgi:hypothetical protein
MITPESFFQNKRRNAQNNGQSVTNDTVYE